MNLFTIVLGTYKQHATRSVFTFLSIVIAFALFSLLAALRHGVTGQLTFAVAQRLDTSNANLQGGGMPVSYYQKILTVPGVKAATYIFTFSGYSGDPHNRVGGFFIPSDNIFQIYPELQLPQSQQQLWLADQQGVMVGPALAKRMGWKAGDTVPIQLMPKKNGSTTWYFHVDGIYHTDLPSVYQSYFVAHYRYFNESVGIPAFRNTAGAFIEHIGDPREGQKISAMIDALFKHTTPQTFTEPEQIETISYLRQFADIYAMSLYIGLAVFFSLLLIVANTIAQSVRERTAEFVLLRVVGFRHFRVTLLIWLESLLLILAGAVFGLAFGYGVVLLLYPRVAALLSAFALTWTAAGYGIILYVTLSLLASLVPAQRVIHLQPSAVLRGK